MRVDRLTPAVLATMLAQASTGLLWQAAYRDEDWIRATWYGNDWITLVIASPLLAVSTSRAAHGSGRGGLIRFGILAYAAYNYAFYLLGAAFNVFFPLYILGVVLSALALMTGLGHTRAAEIAGSFRPTTPVRFTGGTLVFLGTGLACVWVGMWAAFVFAGRPTPVEPEVFKLVAALDLSLMVPALIAGGILLWRRDPWGYTIATIASIQSALYLLVLSVNSVVAMGRGLASSPGELPIWGTLAAITTAVALTLLANVARPLAPPDPS